MRPTMRPIFSFSLLYTCGVWKGTSKLTCPGSLPVIYTNLGAMMVQTLGTLQTLLSRVLLTWNKRLGSQRLLSTGKVCGRGSITQSTLQIGWRAWLRHMKVLSEIPIWISLMVTFWTRCFTWLSKAAKVWRHPLSSFFQSLEVGLESGPFGACFSGQQNFLKFWSYIYCVLRVCFFGISH